MIIKLWGIRDRQREHNVMHNHHTAACALSDQKWAFMQLSCNCHWTVCQGASVQVILITIPNTIINLQSSRVLSSQSLWSRSLLLYHDLTTAWTLTTSRISPLHSRPHDFAVTTDLATSLTTAFMTSFTHDITHDAATYDLTTFYDLAKALSLVRCWKTPATQSIQSTHSWHDVWLSWFAHFSTSSRYKKQSHLLPGGFSARNPFPCALKPPTLHCSVRSKSISFSTARVLPDHLPVNFWFLWFMHIWKVSYIAFNRL